MKLAQAEPDEDVLPRIAAGDPSAVRVCIQRYGALVRGMARRFLRNEALADDATQDIFIELWKHAGKFDRDTARETTFIITIARRRLIDRLRREKARPSADSLEVVAEPRTPDAPDRVEQSDLARRAATALGRLPGDQQKVLQLAVSEGLSYSQIAEKLDTPLGTVKSHARRGLIRLREMLAVRTEESEPAQPEQRR